MSEYNNTKNIFAKEYLQSCSEEVFVVSKIKDTVPWTYVISDLNGEPIARSFYEKELQKTSQDTFHLKNYSLNSWINKKDLVSKWVNTFLSRLEVLVDLYNYATQTDLKNVTHVDTSGFALNTNLASLEFEVDKLDIDKLAPVPVDLSKLSNVKNDVLKKSSVWKTSYKSK